MGGRLLSCEQISDCRPEAYKLRDSSESTSQAAGPSGLTTGSSQHAQSVLHIQGRRLCLCHPDRLCHRRHCHHDHSVHDWDLYHGPDANRHVRHPGTTTCHETAEESRSSQLQDLPAASPLHPNHWDGEWHQSQPDKSLHRELYC